MYLLDTNSLIYFFRGLGNVSHNMFKVAPRDIFVPTVVIYELEVGIKKSNDSKKREEQLSTLLSNVNIVNFSQKEAKEAAEIRAKLEKLGKPIGPIDTLIAGVAVANNLILVTRNLSEFKRVPNLKIVDWF